MKELIEAGVHFGHHTRRWNPKMAQYVYGARDKVHIIDLQQTVPLLHAGLVAIRNAVADGGKVLFVGTKPQARDIVKDAADLCGQFYVNKRWLGGLLTNWKTVVNSIRKLKRLKADAERQDELGLTKKEIGRMEKEIGKLSDVLGGVLDMNGKPDIILVLDVSRENLAVEEAKVLGIPVVGICDTNADPTGVAYPVPGNDDAIKSIRVYCDLAVKAVLDGLEEQLKKSGADIGEALAPKANAKEPEKE
jgi:small subunit ribosomal protein S2